jgi:hypothetical protein
MANPTTASGNSSSFLFSHHQPRPVGCRTANHRRWATAEWPCANGSWFIRARWSRRWGCESEKEKKASGYVSSTQVQVEAIWVGVGFHYFCSAPSDIIQPAITTSNMFVTLLLLLAILGVVAGGAPGGTTVSLQPLPYFKLTHLVDQLHHPTPSCNEYA